MKRTQQLIIGIIGGIFVIGTLIYFGIAKARASTEYHLDNGIEVIPIAVPRDDIAEALDIRVWKFDVTLPDDKKSYYLTLNQYGHGKLIRRLNGISISKDDHKVTLSLTPMDGDILRSQEIRIVMRQDSGHGPISNFTVFGYCPNPFRSIDSLSDNLFVNRSDNRINLMGGGKRASTLSGSDDVDIAVVIEPIFTAKPLDMDLHKIE